MRLGARSGSRSTPTSYPTIHGKPNETLKKAFTLTQGELHGEPEERHKRCRDEQRHPACDPFSEIAPATVAAFQRLGS